MVTNASIYKIVGYKHCCISFYKVTFYIKIVSRVFRNIAQQIKKAITRDERMIAKKRMKEYCMVVLTIKEIKLVLFYCT